MYRQADHPLRERFQYFRDRRDIFLANREAVLELLQRFSEDLTALQRAIRRGDGETLHDWFSRTRAIRRSIIEAKQA